jgi:hypothetical protein
MSAHLPEPLAGTVILILWVSSVPCILAFQRICRSLEQKEFARSREAKVKNARDITFLQDG